MIIQLHRDDPQEMLRDMDQLRTALLDLDVDSVRSTPAGPVPTGSKAAGLVESLVVKLGVVALTTVAGKIQDHVGRTGRGAKLTIDGDSIELTGINVAQQQQLFDIWLARHGSGRS
jgi:hypothetical protein